MSKKPIPNPDPAFQRFYAEKKQAEREAKEAHRVERAVKITIEDTKQQPRPLFQHVTASEIEAAALAARLKAMRKPQKLTKKQWAALRASMSPEVAVLSRALNESGKRVARAVEITFEDAKQGQPGPLFPLLPPVTASKIEARALNESGKKRPKRRRRDRH